MKSVIVVLVLLAASAAAQQRVNAGSLILEKFSQRVNDYVKLRADAEGKMKPLKTGATPQEIADHVQEMISHIRHLRRHAKEGDIFTEETRKEFRRLLALATDGKNQQRISASLKHAEPVSPHLVVNSVYPPNLPVQSLPPTLLMNLPTLPKEVEYRLAGQTLALVDTRTGLVIDVMKHSVH